MRTIRRTFLGILGLVVLITAWKGATLLILGRDLDEQTKSIATFYQDNFTEHTRTLSGALLTRGQQDIIDRIRHLPLTANLQRDDAIGVIIEAQRAYMTLVDASQNTPLSRRPEIAALQKSLAKNGRVQPLLDEYNKKTQSWNNGQDTLVDGLFWKIFGLEPRLLLQADGTMEYETTVTL